MAVLEGGSSSESRAGSLALRLLAEPLHVPVLRAHLDGPLRLADLAERLAGVGEGSLRGKVEGLRSVGGLERRVLQGMPYAVENALTPAGHALLEVAELMERWLGHAPRGPLALGTRSAKKAIGALVGGWDSAILHSLAAHPLSLTELNEAIPDLSYPSVARRLSALRTTQQIEALQRANGSKPYEVTAWARQASMPLLAAGRCEWLHLAGGKDRLAPADVETAILLALPLVSLPETTTGSCLLALDLSTDRNPETEGPAGVRVEIENGHIASCLSASKPGPSCRVLGTIGAWSAAIVEGHSLPVEGPEPQLARSLVSGLREALSAA